MVALWEITSACSHACLGCGNVFKHDGHHVSVDEFERALVRLNGSILDVRLTGGEPSLHPGLSAICGILNREGISFSILSNGTGLAAEELDRIVSRQNHFRGFLISLHGHTAAIHDDFVGVAGSFDRVTKTIAFLTGKGHYVSTNTILHRNTVLHTDAVASLAHSLGASYAVFNRYYGGAAAYKVTRAELAGAAERITGQRLDGGRIRLGNCIPKCVSDCDCDGCPGGNYICTIDPWLRVRPCNHSPMVAGSLGEQSMDAIWHGEIMDKWRKSIPVECESCDYSDQCAGGCRAEGMLLGLEMDPLISRASLKLSTRKANVLRLPLEQKFRLRCLRRRDVFGEALFFEGEVMLVNIDAAALLDGISEGRSLQGLCEQFGQDAVDVVAELLLTGFAEYADDLSLSGNGPPKVS